MQREPVLLRDGSTSSAPLVGIPTFTESGSVGTETFLRVRSCSLGASPLSFERASRAITVVLALGSTVTLAADAEMASALLPTEVEIPSTRELSAAPASNGDGGTAEARSISGLVAALDEEPIEDGVTHPAEETLAKHIDRFGAAGLRELVAAASPARAASLLRLLGRSSKVGAEQRESLVAWGLSSMSIEVRDAAIQAVENWGDVALGEKLRAHREPVKWLAAYASDVIRDLQG